MPIGSSVWFGKYTNRHFRGKLSMASSSGKYAATSAGSAVRTSTPAVAAKKPIHDGTLSDLRSHIQMQ